jgi:hypothetical protein
LTKSGALSINELDFAAFHFEESENAEDAEDRWVRLVE